MGDRQLLRVLFYDVGRPPEVRTVAGFKGIRDLCGGLVDRAVLDFNRAAQSGVHLYCHDEGLINGMAPNLWAEGPTYMGAPIHGPAVVVGLERDPYEGDEDRSLTDDEIARWSKLRRILSQAQVAEVVNAARGLIIWAGGTLRAEGDLQAIVEAFKSAGVTP